MTDHNLWIIKLNKQKAEWSNNLLPWLRVKNKLNWYDINRELRDIRVFRNDQTPRSVRLNF